MANTFKLKTATIRVTEVNDGADPPLVQVEALLDNGTTQQLVYTYPTPENPSGFTGGEVETEVNALVTTANL